MATHANAMAYGGAHVEPTRWTVMIFMGASVGVPDVKDLTEQAHKTINEIRHVCHDMTDAQRGTLNIFLQLHGRGVPHRHHVGVVDEAVPEAERNAANGSALQHFISWAFSRAPQPSPEWQDYRLLVLWGHAYEFTIAPVATQAGIDGIDFAEVTKTFTDLQAVWKKQHPDADDKLNIVGFDSCDLATIEMSWQLHRYAHYSLASQIAVPLPGWPYGAILRQLRDASVPMTPRDLGALIVRRYCGTYEREGTAVALTLLNLDRSEEVFQATQTLADRLVSASDDPAEVSLMINLFCRSQTWEDKPFVDVADLCLNLWRYSSNQGVIQAAGDLGDLLVRPGPDPSKITDQPFVVEHGRNAHPTARLQGVSLYAPHVAENIDWNEVSPLYAKFVFARDTLWGKYVEALADTVELEA